jgi:4-amino-4-deoxy-L-arabinose transferase-like glycosyltransferase
MKRSWQWAILIALLLLGFGLRIYQLEAQSMWSDEGLSLYRARQPLPELLSGRIVIDGQGSQDTNPPLYFVLLHGLRALAGESVFALRYLGVLAALLNLPLLYQIGRRLGGWQLGVGAVFWLTISPIHVWQSQDMRNYTLLLLWNLLSVYALSQVMRLSHSQGSGTFKNWLLLWVTAVLAGIYTHYFGFFVLAFGVLALAIWVLWRWQGWPPPRWLILALGGTGLVMLPLLLVALGRFQGAPQVDFVFVQPLNFISHVFSVFGVGISRNVVQPWWRVAPVLLLAGWGLVRLWRDGRKTAVFLLFGYWFVPLFLLETLSYFNPLYNGARHLIMSLPPFVLLLGTAVYALTPTSTTPSGRAGWFRLERTVVAALALAIMISQAEWLHQQFTSPSLIKDDIKGVAQFLNEVAQPEDTIVLHDTIIGFVFDYYYEGEAAWTAVPAWGQRDLPGVTESLEAAAAGKERIWFVTEPRPRIGLSANVLPAWADDQWIPFWQRRFPALWLGTAVKGYAVNPVINNLPPAAASLDLQWENGLHLAGVQSPAEAHAGTVWQPRFFWFRSDSTVEEITVSLRFIDTQGQMWLQDDQPLWPHFPLAQWPPEQLVQVQPLINLPAGLPPGSYQVMLRLVNRATRQPIATAAGPIDRPLLEQLTVQVASAPADLTDLPGFTTHSVRISREISLLGYILPTESYRPGHLVPLTLYWRVWQPPTANYQLLVEMVDSGGKVTQSMVTAPTRLDYPSSAWQAGDLLQSQVSVAVPGQADRVQTVRITLLEPDGRTIHRPVQLGNIQVVPWEFRAELPSIQTPLEATFGEPPFANLAGYELLTSAVQAGEMLTLTLFWRTEIPLNRNLAIFVHVADDEEFLVGQRDSIPVNGSRPTNSWRGGEALVDTHTFQIRPETGVGTYKLWVGIYDPSTNERLPIILNGVVQPDGRLFLTEVEIR